jgi:hypothetical protein
MDRIQKHVRRHEPRRVGGFKPGGCNRHVHRLSHLPARLAFGGRGSREPGPSLTQAVNPAIPPAAPCKNRRRVMDFVTLTACAVTCDLLRAGPRL